MSRPWSLSPWKQGISLLSRRDDKRAGCRRGRSATCSSQDVPQAGVTWGCFFLLNIRGPKHFPPTGVVAARGARLYHPLGIFKVRSREDRRIPESAVTFQYRLRRQRTRAETGPVHHTSSSSCVARLPQRATIPDEWARDGHSDMAAPTNFSFVFFFVREKSVKAHISWPGAVLVTRRAIAHCVAKYFSLVRFRLGSTYWPGQADRIVKALCAQPSPFGGRWLAGYCHCYTTRGHCLR